MLCLTLIQLLSLMLLNIAGIYIYIVFRYKTIDMPHLQNLRITYVKSMNSLPNLKIHEIIYIKSVESLKPIRSRKCTTSNQISKSLKATKALKSVKSAKMFEMYEICVSEIARVWNAG